MLSYDLLNADLTQLFGQLLSGKQSWDERHLFLAK